MKSQIVVLFTSQEDIEKMEQALRAADMGEAGLQTLHSLSQAGPDSLSAAIPELSPQAGWGDNPAPNYPEVTLLEMMGLTKEEIAFYSQGMEMGGTVLIITTQAKDEETIKEMIDQYNGQTFVS